MLTCPRLPAPAPSSSSTQPSSLLSSLQQGTGMGITTHGPFPWQSLLDCPECRRWSDSRGHRGPLGLGPAQNGPLAPQPSHPHSYSKLPVPLLVSHRAAARLRTITGSVAPDSASPEPCRNGAALAQSSCTVVQSKAHTGPLACGWRCLPSL
jgi:hypothetical protein